MTARRTAARAALGCCLVLAASACQKSSPGITLVSGTHSTHFEAQEWCHGTTVLVKGGECPGTGPKDIKIIRAAGGDQVGIDVDSELTERGGWYLYNADTQQIVLGIDSTHYRTFLADFSDQSHLGVEQLEVRSVDHVPSNSTDLPRVTGIWAFQVVAKTS